MWSRPTCLVLDDERADYQVFNVGGDKAITVAEFSKVVAEIFGSNGYEPRPSGKYRFDDSRHILSDIGKLKGLGWRLIRSVYDSVEGYREWLGEADSLADILCCAEEQMVKLGVVQSVSES